jgi:hypothetical protein
LATEVGSWTFPSGRDLAATPNRPQLTVARGSSPKGQLRWMQRRNASNSAAPPASLILKPDLLRFLSLMNISKN